MRALLPLGLALLAACSTVPAVGESYRLASVQQARAPHGAEFALLSFSTDEGVEADPAGLRRALSAALRDQGRTTLAPDWVDRNVAAGSATRAVPGLLVVSGGLQRWEGETADPQSSWLRAEAALLLESGGQTLYSAAVRFDARLDPAVAADLQPEERQDALQAALAARLAGTLVDALR